MKTVRLITCDGAFQARLIQGALENEGIASVLHNETRPTSCADSLPRFPEWIFSCMKTTMNVPWPCSNATR